MKKNKSSLRAAVSPSSSLMVQLAHELQRWPPFAQMAVADVEFFVQRSQMRYFAPQEILAAPQQGVVQQLVLIRSGSVRGLRDDATGSAADAVFYDAGEVFPVDAALAERPVAATYRALGDTFVLLLPVTAMKELALRSVVFSDFLSRRIQTFLALSRQALQEAFSARTLAEQSFETPLGELARTAPVTCHASVPLLEALQTMHARRIGSMLVTSFDGALEGILTRHDLLGRVTLPQMPLSVPIGQVMVSPVHSLTDRHTAQDAALMMSRHGIRHVPITRAGKLVGIVSERDLFSLQRQSLKQVSTALQAAPDVAALKTLADDIRRFARNLLGQGVQARQVTELVSHLNDVLTRRLLDLLAAQQGLVLRRLCWLALGSEGRGEQTIATDQDNAIVLPDDATDAERKAALKLGRTVNLALDECGYPLCRGGIMAGEPACCLRLADWQARFVQWMEHGAPVDLLAANIYFDFRPLAGDDSLASSLRAGITEVAHKTPRFLAQLAANALQSGVPLNWRGGVDADAAGGIDLKMHGTAVFVDGARLYALSQGVTATNTRERLREACTLMGVPAREHEAWIGAFDFLQMLRLRVQLESPQPNPNWLALASLNNIDRRILREALHAAQLLQERMKLDYMR